MRRRYESVVLSAGLLAMATGVVRAQHPGHHDAAGIRAALLTNRSVQRELKLDGSQAEKVAALGKDVAARARAAAEEFKALPESERREKMHGVMTAACAEAMETLRGVFTAQQSRRFEQIVLQRRGIMAFGDPGIQEKLGLTDAQKDRIHALAMEFHGQMRGLTASISPERMAEVHEQGMTLQRKAVDRAVAILGAEQEAAWKELVGKTFEVEYEGRPAPAGR